MPARRKKKPARRPWLAPVLGLVLVGTIWSAQQLTQAGAGPAWLQFLLNATQPTGGLRVGLVAGHAGNDSGAVCADGLTEAKVNRTVAELAATNLRRQGITVDILDEFDKRLAGYRADALVSVHADSCLVDFSGFKVAGAPEPPDSGALAQCLWRTYESATGLPRHPQTITDDMTRYHAFREVDTRTPAAIIEIGFLNTDRSLLVDTPELAAKGVSDGILCLLAGDSDAGATERTKP